MHTEKYSIKDDQAYHTAVQKISDLMRKGDKKLSEKKVEKLKSLTSAVESYKNAVYAVPAPITLEEAVELKMYERKLKQKDLAKLLGIGEAKLSQIMGKKRKPDVAFLKAIHEQLGIDGNLIFKWIS
ncbi:MAG: helix-turn-helix domain-containing protein [Williamsia sp.]|nr:helix-turn-helix domain-containing protein [Williamsia sp.]